MKYTRLREGPPNKLVINSGNTRRAPMTLTPKDRGTRKKALSLPGFIRITRYMAGKGEGLNLPRMDGESISAAPR